MADLLSEACESPLHRGLRWLTTVAAVVIGVGGGLLLVRHGGAATQFHVFHGEPYRLDSLSRMFTAAGHGNALAVVQVGVLLLIAVPFLRVLFAGIGYARERDWLYVTVAGIVLGVLVGSLLSHK
jgi:uncharacterized membrane protein